MRSIFQRIEHNNAVPRGTPGHGFGGYFQTNIGNGSLYNASPGTIAVLKSQVRSIGGDPEKVIEMVGSDGNFLSPDRDKTQGLWGLTFHADSKWQRFSSRTYVLDTLAAKNADGTQKYPLTLSTHSLATKVLFDKAHSHDARSGKDDHKPKAIGVEYLKGEAIYKADARNKPANKGELKQVFASKEVIIAGGTFNSPQLLQLSGIGDKADLEKVGIKVVANLPGVGRNLQDNQEMPIVGHAKTDFNTIPYVGDPVCAFGTPNDPCLAAWKNGTGPYMRTASNSNAMILKSKHAVEDERDLFIFSLTGAFRGFWPSQNVVAQPPFDTPNTFGFSMVKMHSQNKAGYVKLRSADPTDPPLISFNHYGTGAETDIGAFMDTVAWGRKVMAAVEAPYGPLTTIEPPCPQGPDANGSCGDADREWIKGQTFGHHPTSTCAIGADDDPMAVLDSKFRVRGVEGLRVVDASVFPRIPGAFPVVATFMVSQKAADVIIGERTA